MRVFSLNLMILLAFILPAHATDVFLEPNVFLAEVFEGEVPSPSFLWLTGDVKDTAKEILGRDMGGLRQRYWQADGRTVWIVEEIGKTRPITTGISVKDGAVERVQILIYRESHGWEVRYPFFTDQFQGMTLDAELETSSRVDGISGATLSVRAIVKLVRLSLAFDQLARDGA